MRDIPVLLAFVLSYRLSIMILSLFGIITVVVVARQTASAAAVFLMAS